MTSLARLARRNADDPIETCCNQTLKGRKDVTEPQFASEATWRHVQYREVSRFTETYGFAGAAGNVNLEGVHYTPRGRESKTLMIFMHPASTLQLLPVTRALPTYGVHVLCAGSRYPKNDSALIFEKVLLDIGAWIRTAKEEWGYEKIVLGGWSGGGALSLFYQAQAENPTITDTPAGDPVDVAGAKPIPADAITFQAAHLSRARTLTEWIDGSVRNELDPDDRNPTLDIYNPENGPPFSAGFVQRYRAAQIARNRKITAWVHRTLEDLRNRGGKEVERGFVVHRTMADPRFLDPAADPNDRKPNWCYLGDPETVNSGPVGIGRFSTLRSWLSQWSYDESRADGPANAARMTAPLLAIENSADDAVPQPHTRAIFEAAASADKEHHVIEGATHYYLNQPEQMAEAIDLTIAWLRKRNLLER